MKPWFLYIVRCANGNLYTGITTDVKRRFQEHSISKKGAKALRGKGPLKLVLKKRIGSISIALRVEHGIKQLSKPDKSNLLKSRSTFNAFVRAYKP